ncbi:MAG: glycosyltransferase, partial [Candidatus Hodarchaeota archaeon]
MDSTGYGGAEEYLLKIISGINLQKFNVSLICPHSEQLSYFVKQLTQKNIEVLQLKKKRRHFLLNLIRLLKLFRKTHIVHFNLPVPERCIFEMICCILSGVPIRIATIHLPHLPASNYRQKARFIKIILTNLLSLLTVIITVSETSKKQLSNRYNI